MINEAVSKLAVYALRTGLIAEGEYLWAVNTILDVLKLDSWTDPGREWGEICLLYTSPSAPVRSPGTAAFDFPAGTWSPAAAG